MNNIIKKAQYRIRKFAEVNNIELNEEMMKVPVTPAKEYAKEKGYTIEEVKEMLNGDDSVFISLFPLVSYMEIVYDEDKFEKFSEIDAVQIIIHEYLHYSGDDEAEDEVLSFVIAFEYDKAFEEGLMNCRENFGLEKLLEMYKPVMAIQMKRKFDTMTFEDARRWLE